MSLAGLLLTGCAGWSPGPLEASLDDARRLDASTVTVDFDELYPGEWDRVLFVCLGTTSTEIREALGFEWTEGPDVESSAFLSAIVLASDESATIATQTGPDSDWAFVPCTPGDHGGGSVAEHLATFSRNASAVRFVWDPDADHSYWYVTAAEFERLAAPPPVRALVG